MASAVDKANTHKEEVEKLRAQLSETGPNAGAGGVPTFRDTGRFGQIKWREIQIFINFYTN